MSNMIRRTSGPPLLTYRKGFTPEAVRNTIREQNLQGLRIFAHLKEDRLESLDFLAEYDFLETLHINSLDDADFGFLKKLTRLKELSLSVEGTSKIDLSHCTQLERLMVNWRKNLTGVEHCKQLQLLSIYGYKEDDLSRFSGLSRLTRLIVKTCGIESLHGVEGLSNLESVTLANCKKLTSVRALNGLKQLAKLDFDTCTQMKDITELGDLPQLKSLSFTDCKDIPSIRWIDHFPLLEEFALLGNTVVADGYITPAKRIKHLNYGHKKHYNEKIETPEADARARENMAKARAMWDQQSRK